MDDKRNLKIYQLWAPIYDRFMRPIYGTARQRAIKLLDLQAGEKVLIPGVGTGLDLPMIPPGVHITGIDLTPAMLAKARAKTNGANVTLAVMNAQALQFQDSAFDAVILNLILSVVPDGTAAFRESWRVLRPGGRMVIFDKFLPESSQLSTVRRVLGFAIELIGTDPNRRLSDMVRDLPDVKIEQDEPALLRGQYRIIFLNKPLQP